MNLIVLVLGAATLAGGLYSVMRSLDNDKKIAGGLCISIVGLVIMVFSSSFVIIQTGYTGVRTTFGQISQVTVPKGFNVKIPLIQSIKKVNNKMQDVSFKAQIDSETSERNQLYLDNIIVTYKINPEKSAWIYSTVSDYEQSLVSSAIKSACKELNSTDATNRALIEPLAKKYIQESLDNKYEEDIVTVSKVVIGNIAFDDTYNKKITEKQNAQLDYEQQQIVNQKAVEKADADAKVKLTKANANAEAKLIAAKAESDANKMVQKTLSKDILNKMLLDKWNGELPKVSGGASALFDISGLLGVTE